MKISMKQFCQYMAIFGNLSPSSSHLHPLQVENCDSNSRLVVDEDDNGKFRLEWVNSAAIQICWWGGILWFASLCKLDNLVIEGFFIENVLLIIFL